MNKQYIPYSVVLIVLGVVSVLAGVMFDHWLFEIAAFFMFIAAYIVLFILPSPPKTAGCEVKT